MNKFRRILINLPSVDKRFMSGHHRKYPINPEDAKKLPVFQYAVSKKTYKRIFAWGNIQSGALGVQYIKRGVNFDHLRYLQSPKRISIGEKFEVTAAACGFGFTVYGVKSATNIKLYGTGINTDSQIGYHSVRKDKPLEIIFYPQEIPLPFQNPEVTNVIKLAAGRAHLLILTDGEGIFLLGNNSYGQCGRKIIPDENYSISNFVNHIKKIDGKTIVDVECGQDHSLAVTEDGAVYSCGWGADGQTGLGHFKNESQFTRLRGDIEGEKIVKLACRSDFVMALNEKGDAFGWGNNEYSQITLPSGEQQLCNPTHIKMLLPVGKIKSVAAGGSFCLAVNENGEVFSWGYGLLGAGPAVQQSAIPVQIPVTLFGRNDFQPNNRVENVVCGLSHAAAITNLGDLFTWGRNKSCCLGLGHENDQYFPFKVSLGGHVKEVFCGVDHTVAICDPFV